MWPLAVNWRILLIAAIVSFVIGAATWTGYKLGRASGDRDVRKMLEAGQQAVAKRQTVITDLRTQSHEDADRIARLSRDARLYLCPTPSDGLPGDSDAGAAGNGRAPRTDIADILRQCLRSFGEINRALGAVK